MPSKLPGYLTRIACCILLCTLPILLFAQNDDDISNAAYYGKKFKDEDIMCMSSYRYFTFDKGKNSLNDKVVTIEENAEYEFLSLKKFTSMSFPEYYNKFIVLKSFKRADKYGSKYILVDKSGVDRSVTGDDIFFDDSRVRFFPIRFNQAGSMSRIVVKK